MRKLNHCKTCGVFLFNRTKQALYCVDCYVKRRRLKQQTYVRRVRIDNITINGKIL